MVWTPRFTPSRMPLIDQRWALLPPGAPPQVENAATVFPGGGQYGARINHVGRGYEVSASVFEGYNHLPLLDPLFEPRLKPYMCSAFILKSARSEPTRRFRFTGSRIKDRSRFLRFARKFPERAPLRYLFALGGAIGAAGPAVGRRRRVCGTNGLRLSLSHLLRSGTRTDQNLFCKSGLQSERAIQHLDRNRDSAEWTGRLVRCRILPAIGDHWRIIGGITVIAGSRNDFLGEYRRNSFGI